MKNALIAVSSTLIAFGAGATCVRTGSDVIDMANIECRPDFRPQEIQQIPDPVQRRLSRIHVPYPQCRVTIINGRVNVDPEVYEKLVEYCSNSKVTIK